MEQLNWEQDEQELNLGGGAGAGRLLPLRLLRPQVPQLPGARRPPERAQARALRRQARREIAASTRAHGPGGAPAAAHDARPGGYAGDSDFISADVKARTTEPLNTAAPMLAEMARKRGRAPSEYGYGAFEHAADEVDLSLRL
uniref:Uncharacterized protein n=1 Tax=Triticum urartu TaxID=4572 RepID=A0A8R7UII5_TRIUA